MSTSKPRFTITMDAELLDAIEDYKFDHRIKNQSKAIVELARAGLQLIKDSENSNQQTFDIIKTSTIKTDIESFELLLKRAGLIKNNNDITQDDFEFLQSIFNAVKTYFQSKK